MVELIGLEISEDVKAEIQSVKELGQELGELIDQYEMTQEMSTNLIKRTIEALRFDQDEQGEKTSAEKVDDVIELAEVVVELSKTEEAEPVEQPPPEVECPKAEPQKKGGKKGKKNQQSQPTTTSNSAPKSKSSKKQARQAAKRALQQEKKAQEEAKQQALEDQEIPEEIEPCESEQEEPSEKFELNNENLQLFDAQQNELGRTPDRIRNHQKKVVGFRMAATTPRHQNFMQTHGDSNSQSGDDDFVKIPKRGSSRGSSCIEDAIHQSTISMLGDLFP